MSLLTFKRKPKVIVWNQPISTEEAKLAMVLPTLQEKSAFEYVCGYFFRRLLNLHKEDCCLCNQHGWKVSTEVEVCSPTQLFLFLKRYTHSPAQSASLYQCNSEMKNFVWNVIQISEFCFKKHTHVKGIVQKIMLSCDKHVLASPALCSGMKSRFTSLIARVIVMYQVKWANNAMKEKKKEKCRFSKRGEKMKKLKHN